jgi:outer membrane protein TolC
MRKDTIEANMPKVLLPKVPIMRLRKKRRSYLALTLSAGVGLAGVAVGLSAPPAETPSAASAARLGQPVATEEAVGEESFLASLLSTGVMPIELGSALRLAGVNNPQILIARQRVVEAMALRQLAAAQFLPSLHLGGSYDDHAGNLQQSSGNILKIDRNSVYLGAGANAIAAGTVSIPGVVWSLNISDTVYNALIAGQVVEQRRFASRAVENEMLRRVAVGYTDLLRTEGQYAIARRLVVEAREVEALSETFAKAGAGRDADADRARTERSEREAELMIAEGEVLVVSNRLTELLTLPPTTRLRILDEKVIPFAVVPDPIPLPELLAIAVLNRPELQDRRSAIRQAMLSLDGARVLPFSPTVLIGLSYGSEGGGSNLTPQNPATPGASVFGENAPRFSNFKERLDVDAVAYWALDNMGVGNVSSIRGARARLGSAQLQFLEQLNRVRAEVANAYARTHARFAQIGMAEEAVSNALQTFNSDAAAIRGGVGRPIELLESLRLLGRSRTIYLHAIVDYNQAQLELYVALGQPPADTLARTVPLDFAPATGARPKEAPR